MNIKNIIRFLAFTMVVEFSVYGESPAQSRESLVKAGFVEKFTHFVQWPDPGEGMQAGNKMVIAIIGEDNISEALNKILQNAGKKADDFEIINVKKPEQVRNCKILFVSGTEKNNIDMILGYTMGKPILTIGDTKGFGDKGVIINMFKEGDFIRYEINKKSLSRSGLQINSMLLNYAVIIE